MRSTRLRLAGAAASVAAALVVAAPSATAAPSHKSGRPHAWNHTVADNVLAPFQLAVSRDSIYATDGFMGTVTRYDQRGAATVLASPGAETAGIDVTPDGRSYAYTGSGPDGTYLQIVSPRGDRRVDLSAYEATRNPDSVNTYGIIAGGNPCAEQALAGVTSMPATYTGVVDSHPYAVASADDGSWLVADAAGNDILKVDRSGTIRTLAVLPPQPVTLTAEQAMTLGMPDCVVGVTYAFEPVPTDVELTEQGRLVVSLLPGGPEGAELGPRGKVVSVNARTGAATTIASGFAGASNVALGEKGTIYVAELFAGKVTAVQGSRRWTAYTISRPVAVEVRCNTLFIGQMGDIDFETGAVNGPGSIITVRR